MSAIGSPHHVANAAPRRLVVLFGIGVVPSLGLAGLMLANISQGRTGLLEFILAMAFAGGAVAALAVQVSALAGLLGHRHWAREVALLAQGIWFLAAVVFAMFGVVNSAVVPMVCAFIILALGAAVVRDLVRSWELGPRPPYEDAIHPHGWVTWASGAGAALFLPWLALMVWLVGYVQSLSPAVDLGSAITVSLLATFLALPWFAVHAVAAYGLSRRHDYGLVVAVIGGVIWFFTVVGIPIGIAQLYSVWKVGHPVLAIPSRIDSRTAAPA